jgi:hypothetical protein
MDNEKNLITRAMAAYYRSAHREGFADNQITIPGDSSYVTEHLGREYVVLCNVNGTLAVYRVRTDGILKALKRWPAEITPDSGDERPRRYA